MERLLYARSCVGAEDIAEYMRMKRTFWTGETQVEKKGVFLGAVKDYEEKNTAGG